LSDSDGLRKDPVLGVEQHGDACVVKLGGELDLYNAQQVRQALTDACAASPARVVVDLSEVEFMGAGAVGVITRTQVFLHDASRSLMLRAPSSCVRRLLDLCHLDYVNASSDAIQLAESRQ
jgi:anti-sigma B factor antagonist